VKHRNAMMQRRSKRALGAALAGLAALAIAAGVAVYNRSADPAGPLPAQLPATPDSYLGVFVPGFPASYSGLTQFADATGSKPDVAMYYSGWYVPFPAAFAATAAKNGVVPLVQMDPDSISLTAIAAGQYDAYLSSYAEAVRAYHDPVILSFGHEMNGSWYSWGYRHATPAAYVAAWRHIVTLFRALGARNVTWLWTVNIINTERGTIPRPNAWWPGSAYVNWVGIDGYYLKPNWQFAPLFGPTVAVVREITSDPILIAETGAVPSAGQAAKIADLFAGVRAYGLLGFVWFDATNSYGEAFGITTPRALAAFRRGAASFSSPGGGGS
jgi:mannan endo-1,4-beta-mannosidase